MSDLRIFVFVFVFVFVFDIVRNFIWKPLYHQRQVSDLCVIVFVSVIVFEFVFVLESVRNLSW